MKLASVLLAAAAVLAAPAAAETAREGVFLRRVMAEVDRPAVTWEVSPPPPCLKGRLPFGPLQHTAVDDPVSCAPGDAACMARLGNMSPAQVRAQVIEELDKAEEADRKEALKCLASQMDQHIVQLNKVNDLAMDLRSKYLALQRERTHTQDLLFRARNQLFELESRERKEMADLQRREAEALLKQHQQAIVNEAAEKKQVTEQTQKAKAIEIQNAKVQQEMAKLKEKEAAEETVKVAEQTEKANAKLAAEKVRLALAKKTAEALGEESGDAAAAAAGQQRRRGGHYAGVRRGRNGEAVGHHLAIDDPVTAKLIGARHRRDPGETFPLIVDELDELPDDKVGSNIPEDESEEAETPGYKGKGRALGGNIIVHIGADGVSVKQQESSEESSRASEESSEESSSARRSEESSEESTAPKPLVAEESAAAQRTEHAAEHAESAAPAAAEHAAEHTAEHAESAAPAAAAEHTASESTESTESTESSIPSA